MHVVKFEYQNLNLAKILKYYKNIKILYHYYHYIVQNTIIIMSFFLH